MQVSQFLKTWEFHRVPKRRYVNGLTLRKLSCALGRGSEVCVFLSANLSVGVFWAKLCPQRATDNEYLSQGSYRKMWAGRDVQM